jgi:hypothetical protein
MTDFGWSYPPGCSGPPEHDEAFETVCEWLQEVVLADMPQGYDVSWWSEELANRLGRCSQDLVDSIHHEASKWARAEAEKHRAKR